ncbi:hypothetical protein FBFR_06475 [Flavobacterium fryxellicola]|uniref:Uncharacterized protein n=1 Tax=Flavobacterium fryxellicola TaxID=249352 RepID=A0A167Y6V8_9FLAO|nr:hypothetical protein FBFR_06475 [Flavobacterium fryxellicola]
MEVASFSKIPIFFGILEKIQRTARPAGIRPNKINLLKKEYKLLCFSRVFLYLILFNKKIVEYIMHA